MTAPPEKIERVDLERKHLEGLLKDRIHFYLVFSSLFFVGLYHLDKPIRRIGLIAGTLVSIILCLAIIRTFRLVRLALKDIENIDRTHPYIRYREAIRIPPNANTLLVLIPILLTCLFGVLTWIALREI
jgi:hypothetical protein